LSHAVAQIFENPLLALLYFKENRLGKPQIVLGRMNLASLQEDRSEVGDALLSE
jgi:hypothetical protein